MIRGGLWVLSLETMIQGLKFSDITLLNQEDAERVRQIRNEPDVRKNMYTNHEITPEEHAGWIAALSRADDRAFFAVTYHDEIVGGVGYSSLNHTHKRAEWAYYLSGAAQGGGLESALEFKFLDYIFNGGLVNKLNCEVIDWNAPVIKLHKRFGFVEEGTRRYHVIREGSDNDVMLLGITKAEWDTVRAEMITKRFYTG